MPAPLVLAAAELLAGLGRAALAGGVNLLRGLLGGARASIAEGLSLVVEWRGDSLLQGLRSGCRDGLDASAGDLVAELRRVVSRPYPPASLPGQPPRLRTGRGRDAIGWRMVGDEWAEINVAPSGVHMVFLEDGTRHVAARPWYAPTIARWLPHAGHVFAARAGQIFHQ